MEDISEIKAAILGERPAGWGQIPDIPLYMDQVIAYMSRQLIDFARGEKLTASMVHNYIKDGMVPRSDGKRYSREHIVYLTAINLLKQVLQVKDVKSLLDASVKERGAEGFYAGLLTLIDEELSEASAMLPGEAAKEDIAEAALRLAVSSYARQLACKQLIALIAGDRTAGKE